MPKPTFFQTVLRKPTRSYADPNAASPWADQFDEDEEYYEVPRPSSRYAARVDEGVHLGFREVEAGPSHRIRASQSVVSNNETGMGIMRFPKAAKKGHSSVILRETVYLGRGEEDEGEEQIAKPRKKKSTKARSEVASSIGGWERERPMSPGVQRDVLIKSAKKTRPANTTTRNSDWSVSPSPASIRPPRPRFAHDRSESSSSALSSPALPPSSPATSISTRQVAQALLHKQLPSQTAAPLTPPTSDTSHATSVSSADREKVETPAVIGGHRELKHPAKANAGRPAPIVTVSQGDEDGEDAFFTPRSPKASEDDDTEVPDEGNSMEANASANLTPRPLAPPLAYGLTPTRMSQPVFVPPSISFQPPTPAPLADPGESPFHSEPDTPTNLQSSPSHSPKLPVVGSKTGSTQMQPSETVDDADAKSLSGEVGSDDDEEAPERLGGSRAGSRGRSSRENSFTNPIHASTSRSLSRPASVARSGGSPSLNGARSPSRHSVRSQKTSKTYDDFKVLRRGSAPASEASYGGRSVIEGSVRSGGYGKGGWAAAAASGSRAGSVVPTMYMPTTGHDGWADFHAPPPPRQSRFTPLPMASQPMTFDRLVNGGLNPPDGPTGSSPSEYSDSEEEDDGQPQPSRSYARQDYESEVGYGDQDGRTYEEVYDERDMETPRMRQGSMATYQGQSQAGYEGDSDDCRPAPFDRQWTRSPGPPIAPRLGSVVSARSASVAQSQYSRPMSPYMQSRPTSPSNYPSQPNSPVVPRPGSRIGFETPSFLHPDTLTILPEMSNEDSDRTYQPAPAASAPPRKAASVFGGFARSVKSDHASQEDGDVVPELPTRRSKSVLGGSKWEGSTYGDGVLMESNGRAPESVSGYTNLVLPAGAYTPLNPSKSSPTELNSRILGIPHATMAAITLSSAAHKTSSTPPHLRHNLPPPVDFSSHLKPPQKVHASQLLVQIYATAVDEVDVRVLEDKGRGDVGRWVPGRSFVGRVLSVGAEEKEIVRGDIVIGLVDIRKSGALAEYMLCDRRRLARAPHPTSLSLEQLSLLPLQGVPTSRISRSQLQRRSRALVMDAHTGIPALVCQALRRAGVNVTAVIGGGDEHYDAQSSCMAHGAKGVLTGSPAAVMMGLDEGGWDFVLDTMGGVRVYDAAKRMLKNGGKIVSLVTPESEMPSSIQVQARPNSGLKSLRAAFSSKRKDSKHISFEYYPAAGSGEPEVDTSGMDVRDVLEEMSMGDYVPVMRGRGRERIVPFERGGEVFRTVPGVDEVGGVVRLIN